MEIKHLRAGEAQEGKTMVTRTDVYGEALGSLYEAVQVLEPDSPCFGQLKAAILETLSVLVGEARA